MTHDEREWQMQERARLDERKARESGHDPAAASYRRIAHALRQAPPVDLPVDFAATIARRAEAIRPAVVDARFEQRLVAALVVLLVVSGLGALGYFGLGGLRTMAGWLSGSSSDTTLRWMLAAAGCVGVSALGGLFDRATPRGG